VIRRLSVFLAAALVAGGLAADAVGSVTFVVSGQGFGHGVGLSQCGAYGFASEAGWTFDRILAHFYPGTRLGDVPKDSLRVLLGETSTSVEISSDSPFTATDATRRRVEIPAGSARVGANLRLTAGRRHRALVPPIRFDPGKSPLQLDTPYRGSIVVAADGARLSVVNLVGLEQYLKGVVPSEMPAAWSPEALKAQAVAARSYALATRHTDGDFDVYADVRSQLYGGITAEDPRTTTAVKETAGKVVLAPDGTVARTFFYASSGGRTAAAGDVFGNGVSYLVPVDDPYDSVCPFHRWGPFVLSAKDLRRELGAEAPPGLEDVVVARDSSGRVKTLTLVGADGSVDVPGTAARVQLGLRSTAFDVAVLALHAVRHIVAKGKTVELAGTVRGLQGISLESRVPGGTWRKDAAAPIPEDGVFSVAVQPQKTVFYRLAGDAVAGPPVRVKVVHG
jgi:stage II sporulation protein D